MVGRWWRLASWPHLRPQVLLLPIIPTTVIASSSCYHRIKRRRQLHHPATPQPLLLHHLHPSFSPPSPHSPLTCRSSPCSCRPSASASSSSFHRPPPPPPLYCPPLPPPCWPGCCIQAGKDGRISTPFSSYCGVAAAAAVATGSTAGPACSRARSSSPATLAAWQAAYGGRETRSGNQVCKPVRHTSTHTITSSKRE